MPAMAFGPWSLQVLPAGRFRLDGGAMFGVVPKVVWSRLVEADGDNRVELACNVLLLRGEAGGRRHMVLVDSGNGSKEGEVFAQRMALRDGDGLERGLAEAGLRPEDVTEVLLTHLHFDHAGGCTRKDEATGSIVPVFPNATHFVQAAELAEARRPGPRARASYLPHNWEPLEAAGLLRTVEGACEILPGITLRPFPGHNRGHQGVVIEDSGSGRKLVVAGDLFPTRHHIQPAWVTGYDLDVERCVRERMALLEEVADREEVGVMFVHDPELPIGRVVRGEKGKFKVLPAEEGD